MKHEIKDGYRPNLFDVDIEGYPNMKYLITSVKYCGSSSYTSGYDLKLVIYENENFDVRNSLNKLVGRILTLRAYKRNGDIAYTEKSVIKDVLYDGTFSWEAVDSLFRWNVQLFVDPGL
jgi:hypothetical protein